MVLSFCSFLLFFFYQFVENNGLQIIDACSYGVFYPTSSSSFSSSFTSSSSSSFSSSSSTQYQQRAEVITATLNIASHLARHSQQHYSLLQSIFSASVLVHILSQVRARSTHNYPFLSLSLSLFLLFLFPKSVLFVEIL